MCQRGRLVLVVGEPVAVVRRLRARREVALEARRAAPRRVVQLSADAQRAHAERAALPGRARRHHARRVHADGQQEVVRSRHRRRVYGRTGVFDDERIHVERFGHGWRVSTRVCCM